MKRNIIFFPFAVLYDAITIIRNWLYDKRIFKRYEPPYPSICVGNLTVGGTGKTPHVEWLIRHFDTKNIVTLSRGYGRKTKGFIEADSTATAQTIGDEPFQFYQKFKSKIRVFVCEKRVFGIQEILKKYKNTELIILDDALQHRAVQAHINLLLSDYGRLFTRDFLLPAGLLREGRSGAKRASAVIVSKCPSDLSLEEQNQIRQEIAQYTQAAVFFSFISTVTKSSRHKGTEEIVDSNQPPVRSYQSVVSNNPKTHISYSIPHISCFVSLSAIAQPQIFEDYIAERFRLVGTERFPDHHVFTKSDIKKVLAKAGDVGIISTEKDFVKILPLLSEEQKKQFYYLPIEVHFLEEQAFRTWITANIAKFANQKST